MGLHVSKKIVDLEKHDELEDRIKRLEALADTNNDGVVTREELEQYTFAKILSYEDDIRRLKQKNETLKKLLDKVNKEYDTLLDEVNNKVESQPQKSKISNVVIEEEIKKWLDDPRTNLSLVPDSAEMYIYKKIISTLLGSIEKFFDSSSLEFIGHRIKIIMEPTKPED